MFALEFFLPSVNQKYSDISAEDLSGTTVFWHKRLIFLKVLLFITKGCDLEDHISWHEQISWNIFPNLLKHFGNTLGMMVQMKPSGNALV